MATKHYNMKTLCLVFLAAVIAGCGTAHLSYSGGDGSSLKQAIIIKGAKDEEAGIAAEKAWMEQRHPGFRKGKQSLLSSDGKNYDEIEITIGEGHMVVYFDITDFVGNCAFAGSCIR
jgi:hypothetical protein